MGYTCCLLVCMCLHLICYRSNNLIHLACQTRLPLYQNIRKKFIYKLISFSCDSLNYVKSHKLSFYVTSFTSYMPLKLFFSDAWNSPIFPLMATSIMLVSLLTLLSMPSSIYLNVNLMSCPHFCLESLG